MRVAVHTSDSVFAYKLGDVIEGHHNLNVVTGELTPVDQLLAGLVAQAQAEYPNATVVVERLVPNGDDTSSWVPVDDKQESEAPVESLTLVAPEVPVVDAPVVDAPPTSQV